MKNAQQAGMLCNEPLFWAFLKSKGEIIKFQARFPKETWPFMRSKEDAAEGVRYLCGVKSRRDLDGPEESLIWREFVADFELWKRGIE